MSARPPLEGIRVCDLSNYASGPVATKILSDLGATVIKIERPPAGDPERVADPAQFRAWNRGKHSLALDLKDSSEDRDLLNELLAEADVLVESFRPGVADRMGFGFEAVAAIQPRIVYVSINAYGSDGPYADDVGLDIQYQALSGAFALVRDANGTPVYNTSMPAFDFAAGSYAVIGILAALRNPDQLPARLEVPILAVGLNWVASRLDDYIAKGKQIAGPEVFQTADGKYVAMAVTHPVTRLPALAAALGDPDLAIGIDPGDRVARRSLIGPVGRAIATRPRDEWIAILREHGVMAAPILDPYEVVNDPHIQHMGLLGSGPDLWAAQPIRGFSLCATDTVPDVGADDARIRRHGWDLAD